jgi:hypothetical protein
MGARVVSRFWWTAEDDEQCALLALFLLIPVFVLLLVVTLPVWLPLYFGRGLYVLWRDRN